jgi:patatin-like phospholipase/acyl hydrolase
MSDPPIKLLAIDGGGIRGIIPARIFVELEARSIRSMFNQIA